MIRARSIITAWQNWRARRALERAIPGLREARLKERDLRRCHRSTRKVHKRVSDLLHANMRGR